VLPRSQHGGPGTAAPLNPGRRQPADAANYVYVSDDLVMAWVYAWQAPGRGRPRVLEVVPLGPLEQDPEHGAAAGAWRCEAARVTGILTTPACSEDEARTGWVVDP
jgi:hypothetical protein